MAYATSLELMRRLGQMDGVTDDVGTEALEAAAAEIDGSVGQRYALPVTGERALALLRSWNLVLAEETVVAATLGGQWSDKLKTRVDQVRNYLAMIRDGSFTLADAAEKTSSGGGIALVQCDAPVFGREKMSGF